MSSTSHRDTCPGSVACAAWRLRDCFNELAEAPGAVLAFEIYGVIGTSGHAVHGGVGREPGDR